MRGKRNAGSHLVWCLFVCFVLCCFIVFCLVLFRVCCFFSCLFAARVFCVASFGCLACPFVRPSFLPRMRYRCPAMIQSLPRIPPGRDHVLRVVHCMAQYDVNCHPGVIREGHPGYLGTTWSSLGQCWGYRGVILGGFGFIVSLEHQSFETRTSCRRQCWSTCLEFAYKTLCFSVGSTMHSLSNVESSHQIEMLKSLSHYLCAAKSFSGNVVGGKQVIVDRQSLCKT